MRKSSKKSKGAAVLGSKSEAPTIGLVVDEVMPVQFEPLEPEEVGMSVFVLATKHNKSFRKLADQQFLEGKVAIKGAITLPDGNIIRGGQTCRTEISPALKQMFRDGVLLAGKAPRRS